MKRSSAGVKIACVLPFLILMSSQDNEEIERVKNYLEDFKTIDGYVNLTRISLDYDIKAFDGWTLKKAIEETGVKYVRIADDFISNENLDYYPHYYAVNYDEVLGIDNNRDILYAMYEPILSLDENDEIKYNIPEGYVLEEAMEIALNVTCDELDDMEIEVVETDNSYHLVLKEVNYD